MPQDTTAQSIQSQTRGRWVCWYGHATGHYWGMPRPPYPWFGIVEGDSPEMLTARIAEVDKYHGRGRRL
ncbi:hypothetical protein [Actinomadura decatromicini]|uniref:Uncharacterized protein n=1 Tax=Actinomadura decatromicini TaxID=2604572 RepID=A0A5D3FT73_9ACTN|nr:hypothetical protein [Actinomadura decatromicini]TYK51232.1 hypothetical protein FXF68_12495 [Actinomadura decatromicini]